MGFEGSIMSVLNRCELKCVRSMLLSMPVAVWTIYQNYVVGEVIPRPWRTD